MRGVPLHWQPNLKLDKHCVGAILSRGDWRSEWRSDTLQACTSWSPSTSYTMAQLRHTSAHIGAVMSSRRRNYILTGHRSVCVTAIHLRGEPHTHQRATSS